MRRLFGRRRPVVSRKTIGTSLLAIITAVIFFTIQPSHILIILIFLALLSLLTTQVASYELSKKNSFIIGLAVFLGSLLWVLRLFDVVNAAVFISFITMLTIFLHQK